MQLLYHQQSHMYVPVYNAGAAHSNVVFLLVSSCLENLQSFIWLNSYHNVRIVVMLMYARSEVHLLFFQHSDMQQQYS